MAVNTNNKVVTVAESKQIANAIINKVKDKGYAVAADLGALASKDEVAKTDLASALVTEIEGKASASDLTTLSGTVSTLVGSDTGMSARQIAADELAEQLIPQNAQEALDTLQEISAWIQGHPAEASAINTKLTLGTYDDNGTATQYATVKAYVEAYVADQIGGSALSGSNAIDITSGTISLIVDTANANGITVGANGVSIGLATTSAAGAMSAADKAKLDGADVTAYTGSGAIDITNHVVSVSAVTASTSGVGGSDGVMIAADKEKLDGFEVATSTEIATLITELDAL